MNEGRLGVVASWLHIAVRSVAGCVGAAGFVQSRLEARDLEVVTEAGVTVGL